MTSLLHSLSPSSLSYTSQTAAVLQHSEERISYALGCCQASFLCISSRHNGWLLFGFLFQRLLTLSAASCAISPYIYIQYTGTLDSCGRNKIWGYGFCICCNIFVLYITNYIIFHPPPTHQVSLTLCVIFSWKGRRVGETFLAYCDSLTLHRQNQNHSSYGMRLESGILIPVSNEVKFILYPLCLHSAIEYMFMGPCAPMTMRSMHDLRVSVNE